MGLLRKCFPYYLRYRFPSALSKSRFPRGLIMRYYCPVCEKHFKDFVPGMDPQSLSGVPLLRSCAYCGGSLELQKVFEDRRKSR